MWTEVVSRRDFDLSLEAFHAMWKALEIYWKLVESDQEIGMIEEIAVFLITEFCIGLIGNKVIIFSLKGLLYF